MVVLTDDFAVLWIGNGQQDIFVDFACLSSQFKSSLNIGNFHIVAFYLLGSGTASCRSS